MNKRYITLVSARPPVHELPDDERKLLRKNFHPLAARRLTTLPLLLGELTKAAAPAPEDEWVFASEFGGSISLENYLNSFPNPSPLHFQNSIQPGPIDLVNVARQQPALQLIPVIGAENLFGEALLAALISPAPVVHLVGGEEFSNWAAKYGLASAATFGFYLRLSSASQSSLGELSFDADATAGPIPDLATATQHLHERQPLAFTLPERGVLRLTWQ